jgi:hypothetical protein
MRTTTILAPSIAIALLGACVTSGNISPAAVVVCGPDSVATTDWDVTAVNNYEAAWYFAAADPIPAQAFASGGMVIATPIGALADGGADGGSFVDGGAAPGSTDVARAVAVAAGHYFPNGCASASASANVVTYTLHNCTGPLGLVAASGTVTATFNVEVGMVGVQVAGNNIAANGATVDLSTSATVTSQANKQLTLAAHTQTSGTGPLGNGAAHMGTFTMVWTPGGDCATINGSFTGVGTAEFSGTSTKITNYKACTNQCPQSGTAVSSFNGGVVTVTFDGTANAQCNASDGTTATIPLQCR